MKILIIEDDDNKRQQLVSAINTDEAGFIIVETRSYQSGLRELLKGPYDLVFLDMTMPTFDKSPSESGGRIRPFAGKDILTQLKHRGFSQDVVVFTGFEILGEGTEQVTLKELDNNLKDEFPSNYRGVIYYNAAQNEWRPGVSRAIAQAKLRKEQSC